MSRLDRHVNTVRTKLALTTLLKSLAWSILAFVVVVLVNILVDRFLVYRLPHWVAFFWAGFGVSVAGAVAYAFWRRPSAKQAAVAIDERLGLKEKFSTALYVRSSDDPFAAAAVRDAEVTADNVSLHKRFPVQFPMAMLATFAVIFVTSLATLLDRHPLFASDDGAAKQTQAQKEKQSADTRKLLNKAIAEIDSMPPSSPADQVKIEAARQELANLRQNPVHDEAATQRSALKAMEDMQSIKDKIKEINAKVVQARNDSELFKNMGKPLDDNGPLSDVQKDIQKGDFGKAAQDVGSAVSNFDKMKPQDQQKTAEDMAKLASQLNNIANNKAAQKAIANKLQQMGAGSQQMQQLAQAMQGAANGDKQAQQQVGQLANQIAQQINSGQGMTPQQQQQVSQQVQQMVKQMQSNTNSQQTAQNMAAAASALATQMKAAAAGQAAGQKNGQQGKQGQQAQGQQGQGQGQQAQGQGQQGQGQGQQAQGQGQQGQGQGQQAQGQGQQGQGQGQQGQGQGQQAQGQGQQNGGGQSVADAKAEMQKQLQQMQDAADAQADANAQQGDNGQGNGNGNGQNGNQGGQQQAQAGGQGTWKPGDANQKGAGSGGPGISSGGARPRGEETPVGFDQKIAASVADENGKLLNSRFVKTTSDKGTSHVALKDVIESAKKDQVDEVDQDRISRPEQAVVKRYFDDLQQGKSDGQK
jgi:hypothetical protein